MVERDGFARELPRVAPKERRDQRSEQDSPGRNRHRGQRDPRIGDRVRPIDLDMIPNKKRVPSGVFSVARKLGEQLWLRVRTKLWSIECVSHWMPRRYL